MMTRYFHDRELESGDTLVLNDEESRHLLVVLRADAGRRVVVVDRAGREWIAAVEKREANRAHLLVVELLREPATIPYELYLYPGLMKGKKLERVVRDAAELGVTEVIPCITERSIPRHMSDAKMTRIEAIVREESKLARRNRAMTLSVPLELSLAVQNAPGVKLFLWEEATCFLGVRLEEIGGVAERVSVFTGPEGGFSPGEAAMAVETGCITAHLGDRILRAETAPGVAVTIMQYAWGGFVRS